MDTQAGSTYHCFINDTATNHFGQITLSWGKDPRGHLLPWTCSLKWNCVSYKNYKTYYTLTKLAEYLDQVDSFGPL